MKKLLYQARQWHHFYSSFLVRALPAAYRYGFPGKKLQVYGITGTDGKTTSATMLYHVLKSCGYKVALISTVAAFIGDQEIDTGFHVTSPEPEQIQALLKRCLDEGIEHVVLEVTSHGVLQYRVWGIDFQFVGLTNISNEHLDYFVDYKTYAAVKIRFTTWAKRKAFVNGDDQSYALLAPYQKAHPERYETYSQFGSDSEITKAITRRFEQEYNQWNAQLVWKMAQAIGVSREAFMQSIQIFSGVKGRMEQIADKKGREIFVDFAHTPQALKSVLESARKLTKNKVIVAFGCAGLRDTQKRPVMANIATELADFAVFTVEDPRTEELQLIFRHMKEGVQSPNHDKFVTQPDRREALRFALSLAQEDDVVLITGKGHERTMCFGTKERSWSDQEVLHQLLQEGA